MLISYQINQTSVILRVKVRSSATTPAGNGLTGITNASSGLNISAIADSESTTTTYTGSNLVTISTLGTYSAPAVGKCGVAKVDDTNHPGVIEIQLANSRYAVSGAKSLHVTVSGLANQYECDAVVPLLGMNPYDSIRGGLTALPSAALNSGANSFNLDGSGNIKSIIEAIVAGLITPQTLDNVLLEILTRRVLLTGTTTGLVTADLYLPYDQIFNNAIVYKSTTLGTPVYLWSNGTNYVASTVVGTNGINYFTCSTNAPNGVWTAAGSAGGTPVATCHGHGQLALTQFDQTCLTGSEATANVNQIAGNTTAATVAGAFWANLPYGTAQGGTSSTITLPNSFDGTHDDIYKDMVVVIVGGTGVGQNRRINNGASTAYTASTRVASIAGDRNWVINPDNTSVVVLIGNIP